MGLFDFLRPHERCPQLNKSIGKRTLVVPVDDSQHSLRAVEWAVQNVYKLESDELHLLSVIPRVAGPYPAEVRVKGAKWCLRGCRRWLALTSCVISLIGAGC